MSQSSPSSSQPPVAEASALSSALLFALVFVEGFVSLGAEIVALRRLVPHVGSSITVTAPTIGFFLLALALGYQAGGRVAGAYLARVLRNFTLSAWLIAIGLSGPVVEGLFANFPGVVVPYALLVGGILCPVAYLLGQTVPVLTNLLRHERAGARSGAALYWSTLGSFLGSLSLSLLVMQWLGVYVAILVCAGLLLILMLALPSADRGERIGRWVQVVWLCVAAGFLNVWLPQQTETAYATYRVEQVSLPDMNAPRAFWVNNSLASLKDESDPPRFTRYIERLREVLHVEMQLRNKSILVLGAGGFTLSHADTHNRYVYVDIDPAIKKLAESDFLRQGIQGEFIATDARRFVIDTTEKFDVVLVDAYSAQTSMPAHLVTQEFWRDTQKVLSENGSVFINLLLDPRLATPLAKNMLATIQSVYGPCAVEVLHRSRPLSNVLVQCFAGNHAQDVQWYVDERNAADTDLLRSR